MWTLVGGGMKTVENSRRETKSVLPKGITWYKDKAKVLTPDSKKLLTGKAGDITYDYLVIALGIQTRYDKVINTTADLLNI